MLKKIFLSVLILWCINVGYAQQKVNEKLYSTYLADTVYYAVYTPQGWDVKESSPVMYSFNYGMVTGDYLAAQADYFSKANYTFPGTIIVNIQADMDRIGYTYRTGELTATGQKFLHCLKQEIIPAVAQKYHTTFRSYIGHSYAASYANYLFLHDWHLFNGYLLLAPEKVDREQPPFHISNEAKDFYNKNITFYYVAVGEIDMSRRQDYAREIAANVTTLDSTRFFFRRDSLPEATHSNIVTLAIQSAFEHLYQLYSPYLEAGHTQNTAQELQAINNRVADAYKIPMGKTAPFYQRFAMLAILNKDTAGLEHVMNFFLNNKMKGWNIMQLGMYGDALGLKAKSKAYLEQAIEKIQKDEMDTELGPPNLAACYSFLATHLLTDDKAKAWEYLEKSRQLSALPNKNGYKNIDIYYDMGVFAADNNYRVKDGLTCLEQFISLSKDVSEDAHWLAYRKTDYYIGKCYLLLHDKRNARRYLEKAVKNNPENKQAKALLSQL